MKFEVDFPQPIHERLSGLKALQVETLRQFYEQVEDARHSVSFIANMKNLGGEYFELPISIVVSTSEKATFVLRLYRFDEMKFKVVDLAITCANSTRIMWSESWETWDFRAG